MKKCNNPIENDIQIYESEDMNETIFINVDDENGVLNMNKRLFKKSGHELITFKNGNDLMD